MRAITGSEALDIVASQQHGVLEQTGLSADQTAAAAWTVAGEVRVGGARAIGLAIAVGRCARWPLFVWKIPGGGWVLDRLYRLVAANRFRLPGETPWCSAHPGLCIDG